MYYAASFLLAFQIMGSIFSKSLNVDHNKSSVLFENTPIFDHLKTRENGDGPTLIWVDATADTASDGKRTKEILYAVSDSVHIFREPDLCIEHIKKIPEGQIFLIVSGNFSAYLLPLLAELRQIECIFIFCMHSPAYEHLKADHRLVVGIYEDQESLISSIKTKIQLILESTEVFSMFNKNQKAARCLTRESASFLWCQLLTSILLSIPTNESDKEEMLHYCQVYCKGNEKDLRDIERFKMHYKSADAIEWYKEESFLYKLLNRALRTEDVEALYIFRFYINDLSKSLRKKYAELKRDVPEMRVYRGQRLKQHEVDLMQDDPEKFFAMNGYLSTSKNRKVALRFAKKIRDTSDLVSVLFIIDASTSLKNIAFADVTHIGSFRREEEVLFDMGSIFEITSCKYSNRDSTWIVTMRATDRGDDIVNTYSELMKKELDSTPHIILLGQLLMEMGNYTMAYRYFCKLTQRLDAEDKIMGDVYYNLARACGFLHMNTRTDIAYGCFQKAYQLQKKQSNSHVALIRILNGIGWLLQLDQSYEDAREEYTKAIDIWRNHVRVDHPANAETHSYLAQSYVEMDDFYNALYHYQHTLEIHKKLYPLEHSRIGSILNDIGDVYRKWEQFNMAFDYYNQAYQIYEKTLPTAHPLRAYCLSCFGFIHQQRGNIEEGQEYHQKAYDMYKATLPPRHINIETSRLNALCSDYKRTVDSYLKTLYF